MPERAEIKRLTELWNYERYGYPVERHGQYFYTYNDGLQNQSPIYVSKGLKACSPSKYFTYKVILFVWPRECEPQLVDAWAT